LARTLGKNERMALCRRETVRSATLRKNALFAEGHLDRVEVARVLGQQVAERRAALLDRLTHACSFVEIDVVHDDDVAAFSKVRSGCSTNNAVSIAGLGICALSAAAAIFLILELGH
jgi:hypothetical protein